MSNKFVTISITRPWREDSSPRPSSRHSQHCRPLNDALGFSGAGREKKRTSRHTAADYLCLWMGSTCLSNGATGTRCWQRGRRQAKRLAGACAKFSAGEGMRRRCASGVTVGACCTNAQTLSTDLPKEDETRSFVRKNLHHRPAFERAETANFHGLPLSLSTYSTMTRLASA